MRTTQPTSTHNQSSEASLPSHLKDDALNTALPKRTWGEFVSETSKRLGLGTAMLGAGLGLSGFGPIGAERKAEGGIIISGGNDAQYRANGEAFSVFGGGNTGFLRRTSELGVFHSSLVFINPTTAVATAHQFNNPAFGLNQSYEAGTSPDFNNPGLGTLNRISSIIIHPDYGGSAGAGIDLAVLKFEAAVPGVINVVFAPGMPNQNETVWFSGYGETGDRTRGYVGQDGFIRAGTSRALSNPPLLGTAANGYMNAQYANYPNFPTDLRTANGDSGGGTWNSNGELWGINIGASTAITGTTSVFLSTSAPPVRNFIDQYSSTAVPEPSSLALAGAALGVGAWLARRRAQQKSNSESNKNNG